MAIDAQASRRVVILLVVLATLPYLNAVTAGFTLDDEPQILTNTAVTRGVDPMQILAAPLYPGNLYRPVTVFTFALNEALRPGDAAAFHLVNLVLHAAVVVVVFWFAVRLFGSGRIALIAAALFALHPIHTEAVTSLVGRAELLAALFGLLAVLLADRMDTAADRVSRVALQALALICFSLSILSKESGLMVLPLIFLFRIARRAQPLGHGLWTELRRLDWVPFLLCALAFVLLRTQVISAVPRGVVTPLDNAFAFVPLVVRLRSALGVLWDYFGLLNVPLVLAADYSYAQVPLITSWLAPRCLGGLGLVIAAVAVFIRQRPPAVGFAALFPFVALALTANLLLAIGTVKAERLLYLPSVGWALLVGYGFDRLLALRRYRRPAVAVLAIMVAAFGARTWTRNWDWHDNFSLYRSMVRTAPNSAKSRYNFGVVLQERRAHAAAEVQFRQALAIHPQAEGAALGIGVAFEKRGFPEAAVEWYEKSLHITPSYHEGHTNLCHVLLENGRLAAAAAACRNGLRYHPADANLLKGLGASLVASGATEKGAAVLRRSLALNRDDHELRLYLAQLGTVAAGRNQVVTVQ